MSVVFRSCSNSSGCYLNFLVAFSLLLVSASGSPCTPNPKCTTDEDCSLNGVCTSGSCVCYPPWGGKDGTCGEFLFKPITGPAETNGYPGKSENVTSWGGNVIFYDGLYHLFVAEMSNNCTLAQWGSNSRCAHAISSTPEGPYERIDIALPTWCHNPQVSYIPNGGGSGVDIWALWHIGDGNGDVNGGKVCLPNGTVIHEDEHEDRKQTTNPGSRLHLANSPNGPWIPWQGGTLPDCNNPTQFQHPNGTWFLVCDSNLLWRAPNITGPYDFVTQITRGGTPGIFEDGLLWIDKQLNWHMLFHTYTMPDVDPIAISGHSFSRDGLDWVPACVQPYFNIANVTDGSQVVMSTRERPKLLFNSEGEPTHLFNGICPMPHCPPQGAIQCKVQGLAPDVGYWDHTLVVPLALD